MKMTLSAADVKIAISVLIQSLKSSILGSTNFQMDKTFWGVVSTAVEQSRCKAYMVAQGDDGKFGPLDPRIPTNKKNGERKSRKILRGPKVLLISCYTSKARNNW